MTYKNAQSYKQAITLYITKATSPHCPALGLSTCVLHAGSHTVSYPSSPISAPGSAPSVLQ